MDIRAHLSKLKDATHNLGQRLRLRRRNPWNWCVQTLSLALLPFGLVSHSAALLGLSGLGLVAGCLALPLPPMEHTELRRLVPHIERFIGWENEWLARPFEGRKKRQVIGWLVGGPLAMWLLWQQDLGPTGLAIAALYLLHVRRKNIEDGIEP